MRATAWISLLAALGVSSVASAQPASRQGTVTLTTAQAEGMVREVSATVEQLRHLRFKSPVAVEVVDGATARKDFESDIDDAEREEAKHTRDAWVHLGLVPATTDLVAAQLDLAETDVLGYYHSGSKKFRLLDHVPELEIRSVMAHELTHALEDQHYDLAAVQKRATNEDQAIAIRAVIEGSAMVSTLAMLRRQGGIGRAKEEAARTGRSRAKTVQKAPTFVQMRLLLPYTLGFSFLLRGKPWEFLFDGVRLVGRRQGVRTGPLLDAGDPAPRAVLGGRPPRERPPADDARPVERARGGLEAGARELDRRAGAHGDHGVDREDRRLRGPAADALDHRGGDRATRATSTTTTSTASARSRCSSRAGRACGTATSS